MIKFARPSLPERQIQMTGNCCVLKFLRCSVDGKDLMRFQSENITVFKSLRRCD